MAKNNLEPMGSQEPFDEFLDAGGAPLAHQVELHAFLAGASALQLQQLSDVVRKRITEQEVTFNILGVPNGTNRPWHLDPIPHIVAREEWEALKAGLTQRARLLSSVHEDIFGEQRLLREGVIPAALVLGNPHYARACRGWQPVGGHTLHLYAADLSRNTRGGYSVFSDRVAAPTGSGYALENRLVVGRTLGKLFNSYGVEKVHSYFSAMRQTISQLSPRSSEDPRVVLLSPGAQDESSFEHAYLARYLGYDLAEGRDLTVRDQIVYLKTLSGLCKVDVILRRISDDWCDPLNLREDSMLGVPGLVDAAQAGNVGIANPLGIGLLESPAIKGYLSRACRALFDEDLLLPSVDTLWCGDQSGLDEAMAAPRDFIFKPAFHERHGEPWVPCQMSQEQFATFRERVLARPSAFVAERWGPGSTVPVLEADRIAQGKLSLRTFLCRSGSGYCVMPGGLSRMNDSPDGLFLSVERERASKDVWIPSRQELSDRPPPRMPDRRMELRRGGLDLPSRLLDDIYWLGRSLERCDMTARLARAGFENLALDAGFGPRAAGSALLKTMQRLDIVPAMAGGKGPSATAAILAGALLDERPSYGLPANCERVHQLTLKVRSRLSRDAWHVLRRITAPIAKAHSCADESQAIDPAVAVELLDDLLTCLSAASGTIMENMVRGHAWVFLDMGRRVERGAMTLSVLLDMLPEGATRVHMETLLEVSDSLLTYRARYLSSLQAAPVVDLLLTDDTNPRSLAYQVERLAQHIRTLPRLQNVVRSRAERRIIELEGSLATADIEAACAGDGQGFRQLVEDAQKLLWQFSDDVTRTWFSHASLSHSLSLPHWVDEELEAG